MMRFFFCLFFLLLAGCASLSRDQCVTADWYQIGQADGARGYQSARWQRHAKACGVYAISVDTDAYQEGYSAGLAQYCTADTGYRAGREGWPYREVCQGEAEAEFLRAYLRGQESVRFDCWQAPSYWHLPHAHYFFTPRLLYPGFYCD